MRYSIKYSLRNIVPADIAVGVIMTAVGGAAIVFGYKFATIGLNTWGHGVGFRVSKKR